MAPNGKFFSTKNEAVLHFRGQTLLDKLFQKKEMAVLTYKPFKMWNLNQFGLMKSEMVHVTY